MKSIWLGLCSWFICQSAFAVVIHAGLLIDGDSKKARENVSIVIEGKRIVAIKPGFVDPGEEKLIDLSGKTVLPGLMDMHVHLDSVYDRNSYLNRFIRNEADYALNAAHYAQVTLMSGFTTVRNPGDNFNATIALRKAIDAGMTIGPRVYSSGKSIATTGGHADPTNGYRRDLAGDPGPKQGVINGADEGRKAIRQRYKDGADFIKLTVTGGVLSVAKSGDNPQFTEAELKTIVETANDYNLHVAVHAHGAEGMKRAIRAGVSSVEHGTYMDSETIKLMKRNGTWYVPTITAGKWVAEKSKEEGFYPALVRPKAARIGPLIQDTFARALRSGVKIAFGTDAGVFPHGLNAREFAYMVEAGMSPMAAIQSATVNTAQLLGVSEDLGSISTGKLADIIAVEGNPLEDIKVLESVDFVMKDGVVYKQP